MKYTPYEYQRFTKQFILDHSEAGIFLDMGMGKTSITLTAINELLFDYFAVKKILVIAPLKPAEDTWPVEIEKWDHLADITYSVVLGSKAERLAALAKDTDVYIINRENVVWLVDYYKKKWPFLPYDFDTALGINNEGALVFSYNLEDIDTTAGGADVFNGQQSVLWINLRQAFYNDIKTMYQNLRSTGSAAQPQVAALSFAKVEEMFETHQAKWGEAIFNEDAYFKYLAPLIEDGSGAYLAMLQGSKAEQRKWWLYNRFKYLDSKYNAGDAQSDVIQIRGYAKSNVAITPYADVYASVKYGSYLVQTRATRNQTYTLVCPLDNVNDTEIYIYSASQLASVGDLSGFKVGYGLPFLLYT